MPRVGDKSHHCKECGKSTAEKSQNEGVCETHQEICPVHTYWFYYKGEKCIKCAEDEERKAIADRKEKEEQEGRERLATEKSWFADGKKDRRPRTKDREAQLKQRKDEEEAYR